jgi:Hemopexin
MSKAYFLQGERYLRYDVEADRIDSGYPRPIAVGWAGLQDAGFDRVVDTVVDLGSGKAYLFKGDAYVRVDQRTNRRDDGYPRPIAEGWAGFADVGFGDSLDASLNWGNGKAYFFRGSEYIRYDIASDRVDEGYPLPITANWPGFEEAGFADGVDAAVNWGNGTAYFFSGGVYLRYDIAADAVATGFPVDIADLWGGFAEAGFGLRLDAAWVKITPAEGVV